MSNRETLPLHDPEATARVAARNVIMAGLSGDNEALAYAALDVAKLTADVDPDSIDKESHDYRMGSVDALSTAINAVAEATPGDDVIEYLQRPINAEIFTMIAAEPGIADSAIPLESEDEIVGAVTGIRLKQLKWYGLIEPAPSEVDERAWKIAPFGREAYIRLLPQLVEAVGMEKTLDGLRSILENPPS